MTEEKVKFFVSLTQEVKILRDEYQKKSKTLENLTDDLVSQFLLQCKNTKSGVISPDGKTPLVISLTFELLCESEPVLTFDYPVHRIKDGKFEMLLDDKAKEKVRNTFKSEKEIPCKWVLMPDRYTFFHIHGISVRNNFLEVVLLPLLI
jgi:hypothetical protein